MVQNRFFKKAWLKSPPTSRFKKCSATLSTSATSLFTQGLHDTFQIPCPYSYYSLKRKTKQTAF